MAITVTPAANNTRETTVNSFINFFALSVLISLFCLPTYAALETKVLGFKQISDFNSPVSGPENTLSLTAVNPNLPVWICLYYVGLKQGDNRDAYNQIALYSDDLLLSSNPQVNKLLADALPNRQEFALDENSDVEDLLDQQLDTSISPVLLPIDVNAKKIRVYSTTADYTQSIDADGTLKLSVFSQQQQDFKPLAIYVIVGQGEQPEALTKLRTIDNMMDGDSFKRSHQMAMREAFTPQLKLLLMIVAFCGLFYMYKNKD